MPAIQYYSQWDEAGVGHEACGETCVQMALSASGLHPTCLEMVNLVDPERNGTTAGDLQALFTHYGIRSYYYSDTALPPAPAILLFNYGALSRSDVQDTQFKGLHWFIFLGIDGDQAIFDDPDWGLWGVRRSEGENKRYKLAEVKAGFTGEAITWEDKVSNIPTKGTVKSDLETLPKFLRVRAGANSPTVIGILADGAVVNIIGSANDTKVPPRLWYNVSIPMGNPALFNDEKLASPLAGSPFTGWCAGWLIDTGTVPPPPPPPVLQPAYSIVADKTSVPNGGSATLTLDWHEVGGAWLAINGGAFAPLDGSVLPLKMVVTPAANSVYALRILNKATGAYETKSVAIAVVPVVVVKQPGRVGFNGLFDAEAMRIAYQAGCRMFWVMNNTDMANELAADPNCFVGYREWWDHNPSVAECLDKLGYPRLGIRVKRCVINECEYIDGNDIKAHAEKDIAVAQGLKAQNSAIETFFGTYSMGTPDETDPAICALLKQYYAPAVNSGLGGWDGHTYSPNMQWIYRTNGALLAAGQFHSKMTEKVGRDFHLATREILSDVRGIQEFAFGDQPTYQDWYETRQHLLVTRCGFHADAPVGYVSSETGVDEGGVGGFSAHGASDQAVVEWCIRYEALSNAPVGGVVPNWRGGAIFQLGKTNGRWDGYDMRKYVQAMAAAGLWK